MSPIVWFTGLSGSGKSTIARSVGNELRRRSVPFEILDGDVFRASLCSELGFSREGRCESLRRLSFVAGLLSRHNIVVLVAAISPYNDIRAELRKRHPTFIEAFINAPLEVCEKRDPKGLYRRARSGEIPNFTGVSDPYEPPLTPDVECQTDRESVEFSSAKVIQSIESVWAFSGPWNVGLLQTAQIDPDLEPRSSSYLFLNKDS